MSPDDHRSKLPCCARLYAGARPWIDSGKVRVRRVIIGILAPSGAAKAAALLADANPSAPQRYESDRAQVPARRWPAPMAEVFGRR